MIYTLTLNPAVDYVVRVDTLNAGSIMRSTDESVFFGGKGINVSTILSEHGIPSVALGFAAGFTGQAIIDGLRHKAIGCDFVILEEGFTRINIKIRSKNETDINTRGPRISASDMERLFEKLDRLKDGDTLVLAGSIPPTLDKNIYEKIMERQSGKNIRFVVDATGDLLVNSLKYKPFLIKPNSDELGEIFSVKIGGAYDAAIYAAKLRNMGAVNVLVSMGADGALLLDENGKTHIMEAYDGKVVNTVGAGDSMVAGFIAGYEQTGDYGYALNLGSASGSATAFCEGLANIDQIMAILK